MPSTAVCPTRLASEMSLEPFRANLRDPDPDVRAYFIGKLMRQAKPDDGFSFVTGR